MANRLINLTGQRFGRLVVLERDYSKKTTAWKCQCDCGNIAVVTTKNLRQKGYSTKSCGCLNREGNPKHRMSRSWIYSVWIGMKRRCFDHGNEHFKDYGERGITVCDEWKEDFQSFYGYVSQLPHFGEAGYTIDRINNDGNYEPGNVRWATHYEQVHNRRCSKRKEV